LQRATCVDAKFCEGEFISLAAKSAPKRERKTKKGQAANRLALILYYPRTTATKRPVRLS